MLASVDKAHMPAGPSGGSLSFPGAWAADGKADEADEPSPINEDNAGSCCSGPGKPCMPLSTDAMYPRLRDLREDRDLSQREVAKLLEMSQTGYSKYETGENDIPTSVLQRLDDFYNVSVDYLLGRTNQKAPYPKK